MRKGEEKAETDGINQPLGAGRGLFSAGFSQRIRELRGIRAHPPTVKRVEKERPVCASFSLFLPKNGNRTRLVVTGFNTGRRDRTRLVVPLLLPNSPKERR